MFEVSISVEKEKILGEFLVNSYFFEPSKYNYAFYLYRNNERVDVAWYSNIMKASFDLKNMSGVFYIKVFIKDIEYEDARSYVSEKLVIEDYSQSTIKLEQPIS